MLKDEGLQNFIQNLAVYADSDIEEKRGVPPYETLEYVANALNNHRQKLVNQAKVLIRTARNETRELLVEKRLRNVDNQQFCITIPYDSIAEVNTVFLSEEDALIIIAAGIRLRELGVKLSTETIHHETLQTNK
ncbi:MAG: hypothetical protein Q9M91_06255 [Candidatus Dojkabacteria bacterium]|nr:hypothetical protein [Candidatus Dojkabacteria bacterium]MDQ7021399.1 hypothetical protein [Candidatus Dojkabacteria bacterium]